MPLVSSYGDLTQTESFHRGILIEIVVIFLSGAAKFFGLVGNP